MLESENQPAKFAKKGLNPHLSSYRTCLICGIKHTIIDFDQAIAVFTEWIKKKDMPHQVCISNVHTTIMGAVLDKPFGQITNNSAMVTIDGQPLRWYVNLIYDAQLKDRVNGPDLMRRCFDDGQSNNWRHFLLGGKNSVLETLSTQLLTTYPKAKIVGKLSPPFRPLTKTEIDDMIETINNAEPDFLWVGLGAPKQERWIADNINRICAPMQIGVGAAYDFLAGNISRAPVFIQKIGLEWLYRIICDPRLAKRYFVTNPIFLYMFFRDLLKKYLYNLKKN